MRASRIFFGLIVLGGVALGASAAGAADHWTVCAGKDNDRSIMACTAILAQGSNLSSSDRAEAYFNRGVAYGNKGDYDRAIANFDQALRLEPKKVDDYATRGWVYAMKGDFDRAIADSNEALRLDPKNSEALAARGLAYTKKGNTDRAMADVDEALRLDPKNDDVRYSRGAVYENKGDLQRALADFRKALDLEPRDAYATAAIIRVQAKIAAMAQPAPVVAQPAPVVAQSVAPASPAPPPPAPQNLGRRLALVIGNANYQGAALANPTVDADHVAASLKDAGFAVTEVKDVDFAGFDAALTAFAEQEAPGDIVLFYFAGHGFALPGDDLRPRNYLMSTSADLQTRSDALLRRDGISLDTVIQRIAGAARVTLAFVDACRNDPFHRGAGDRGFERIGVPVARQVYIGMSTELGKTALDGAPGEGSPFARAFAARMTRPGLRIDDAFRALRAEVAQSTDGKQAPEVLQDELAEGAIVLVPAR